MSFSKFVIKKDRERHPQRRYIPEASYLPQVIDKLKAHPSFKCCNDLQLSELASRITKAEELLKYFDLTQDLAEDGGTGAIMPRDDVDSLEVQLVLKFLSHKLDTDDIESILLHEYGPLQAYLVIGDMILEWGPDSVIVPHGKPMKDEAAPSASSTGASDVREAELPSVKVELLKTKVLEIVAEHNKRYHFHPIRRSTHGFVCSIIQAMDIPQPTQVQSQLKDYLDALERSTSVGSPKEEFQTHSELDRYVEQNGARLTDRDIEYLIFQYFMFHVVCRTKHHNPQKWNCTEKNCKMMILKATVKPKILLLNKYRTVKYTFHESTVF